MKRIYYAGISVVTTDATADALFSLALSLAKRKRIRAVEVPHLVDDGRWATLTLMLLPTEPVVIDDCDDSEPDIRPIAVDSDDPCEDDLR